MCKKACHNGVGSISEICSSQSLQTWFPLIVARLRRAALMGLTLPDVLGSEALEAIAAAWIEIERSTSGVGAFKRDKMLGCCLQCRNLRLSSLQEYSLAQE